MCTHRQNPSFLHPSCIHAPEDFSKGDKDVNQISTVLFSSMYLALRVPGLPIRDCARGCNNRSQSRPMMSAIDVTAKTFFERLYLVVGLRKIAS